MSPLKQSSIWKSCTCRALALCVSGTRCDFWTVSTLPPQVLSGASWGNLLVWDGSTIKVEICRKGGKSCHCGISQPFALEDELVMTMGSDGVIRVRVFSCGGTAKSSWWEPGRWLLPLFFNHDIDRLRKMWLCALYDWYVCYTHLHATFIAPICYVMLSVSLCMHKMGFHTCWSLIWRLKNKKY